MIRYLFVAVPHLLFEPVAVGSVLGLTVAFLFNWKKHDRFYWIITGTILFMLIWRLGAYSVMVSSRYASVLLYPAIIFTTWACFKLKDIVCELLKRNTRLNPQISLLIPVVLIAGIAVACLVKTLRYDPYAAHTVKISEILKKEIEGKDVRLFCNHGATRISYYAKININDIKIIGSEHNLPDRKFLVEIIQKSINFFSETYFVFYIKKGETEPTAEYLQLSPDQGKWECLHREYTSKRKNKEVVLYCLTPFHPNVEIWEKPIPEISAQNLCVNGDFERILEGKALDQRIGYYKKLEASDFYTIPGKLFPVAWWLGVAKAVDGKSPEMALTSEQPLAGKYSLEINSNGMVDRPGVNSTFIAKQDGIYEGFIRTREKSTVYIYSCCWNKEKKETNYIRKIETILKPGKTYKFTIPVSKKDIAEKDDKIYIVIQCTGCALFDNIEFLPMKEMVNREL